MLKEHILSACVKTNLSLDVNLVREEIEKAQLVFNTPVQSGRGLTHQHVKDVFLRGDVKSYVFHGGLEEENPLNNSVFYQLPTIQSFLSQFPGLIGRVGLFSLSGDSVISIHRDHDEHGYFNNTFRFHVPIITHKEVLFFNAGKFYRMKEGEVWIINNLARHGVINDNKHSRLHLVFDVFITDELTKYVSSGDDTLGMSAVEMPEILNKLKQSSQKNNETTKGDDDIDKLIELLKQQIFILERMKRKKIGS